ncbi:deoxynucleotide monophosphate kinase family protein [Streptomyces collinus]
MHNIALLGKAGSGKDTVAAHLVAEHGYTRLAFADPLKDMALEVNPFVTWVAGEPIRLATLVNNHGWDRAKEMFPEIRRTLQHMGQTVRERDRSFWIRALLRAAVQIRGPIVVTDVRYLNEYAAMQRAGFSTVRVTRPGAGLVGAAGAHHSETELDDARTTSAVLNDGSLDLLRARVDQLFSL